MSKAKKFTIDVLIFLCQLPFTSTNGVILGILYALLYSVVLDRMLMLNQGGVQLIIFSKESKKINEELLKLGYGTTFLNARGGYLQEETEAIYTVVNNRVMNSVKKLIQELDENAFITITSVSEIRGNGFTKMFRDENYVPEVDRRSSGKE